jgi:hypothetical protein
LVVNGKNILILKSDGARISNVNKSNKLISHYFDEAKTLYELFLRALKVSSKPSDE